MYQKTKELTEIFNRDSSYNYAKDLTGQRLSANAMIFRNEYYTGIVYQNTLVFEWSNGSFKFNTDGWESKTTKKWINYGLNLFSRFQVVQRKFTWYLTADGKELKPFKENVFTSNF